MQPTATLTRQRGQIVLVMALALTGLLGAAALGVDLGFSYAHRREVQNAADAAAAAGVQALSRHYAYVAMQGRSVPFTYTADATNSDVRTDMTRAVVASLPNFPGPLTVTALPSNVQLLAYYILPTATADCSSGCMIVPSSGSITTTPPAANDPVGVKATVGYNYPTFFARIFGVATTYVESEAYAKLFQSSPRDAGAPFVICGTYSISGTTQGAYRIGYTDANNNIVQVPPGPQAGEVVTIVTSTPARVDYPNYTGSWFLVHGAQLPQGTGPTGSSSTPADCGHNDAGWKGSASQNTLCVPLSSAGPIPCSQQVDNGNSAGPLRNRVLGAPGCDPGELTGCLIFLPISNGPVDSTNMNIVDWAPFYLVPGTPGSLNVPGCNSSNCHSGQLAPYATCGGGCIPTGAFTPGSLGGIVTFKLVQQATSTS